MENRNNRGGMRGPGMGRRPAEKSKDFKGTWMKIIRYCKRYLAVIVVALICAVAGTILTILGPDKLSDLTKVITEGIATGIDMERVKSIGLTLVAFYVASAGFVFWTAVHYGHGHTKCDKAAAKRYFGQDQSSADGLLQ